MLLKWVCLAVLYFASASVFALVYDDEVIIQRGDANVDSYVNISDASYINNYLFNGGPAPPCMNQADVNDDGSVDQSDTIYLLNWLYSGGPAPPDPGPYNTTCEFDAEPRPGCATSPCS